mgnify:CR=1 FL=1
MPLHVNLALLKELLDIFFKFILLFVFIKMLAFDVFNDYIVSDIDLLSASVFGYRGLLLGYSERLSVMVFRR